MCVDFCTSACLPACPPGWTNHTWNWWFSSVHEKLNGSMKCVSGVRCGVCGSTETKPNCWRCCCCCCFWWRYCCTALLVFPLLFVCDSAASAAGIALVGCVFWVNQMGECYHTLMCGAVRFVYYDFIFTPHAGTNEAKTTYLYAAISKTLLRSSHFVHNRRIVGCASATAAAVTIPRWFFISVPLFLFVNPKTKTIDLLYCIHEQRKTPQIYMLLLYQYKLVSFRVLWQ